ncbi:hypothetical protein [Virgibacillus sp. SK37]|uniref:hypothetical protein n=1 Tax=Virgibacillus sp. SK37 TaxID=403957 RepID=UPI0004D0C39F|nr:hypothetical protein [Virgibacillus sp. SK37]AIF42348.1 5,10-methylene-tetrahydrofolate dehydrogenase [Virgibacillus sp. SK37]
MDKEKVRVGLIAAPELPAEIANRYVEQLPEAFEREIDDSVTWEVEMVVDPLTGAAENVDKIIEKAAELRNGEDWGYAICLTDLPIFDNSSIVAADISKKHYIAQLSVPSFGWLPIKKRMRKAVIQIMNELYNGSRLENNDHKVKKNFTGDMLQRQFPLTKVKRISPNDEHKDIETRYIVIPKINGEVRLLMGMTQANRPWSIMSSFKKVIAIAFSTGAFALIFTTLWNLSDILSTLRLSVLSFAAISLMVIWIITAHNLWERPSNRHQTHLRHLYNQTTLITLLLSVLTYYLALFLLFLITVIVIVPPEAYNSAVNREGDFTIMQYIRLAWIGTSISTIAGAIGAGLENEELVRDITYGYRQKRRYKEVEPKDD